MLVGLYVRLVHFLIFFSIVLVTFSGIKIDRIIMPLIQKGLHKKADKLGVTAMAIKDHYSFEAITGYFITGSFQQIIYYTAGQSKCAGLLPGLIDLPVKIIGKNNCIFLLCCPCSPFTHMDQVCP